VGFRRMGHLRSMLVFKDFIGDR